MNQTTPLFTVTVEEPVTAEQIDNLLSAAFEGGSNYWISRPVRPVNNDYRGAEFASGVVSRGGTLIISVVESGEDETTYKLDLGKVQVGIAHLLRRRGQRWSWFYERHDANDADAFLQFCLFGELVFG